MTNHVRSSVRGLSGLAYASSLAMILMSTTALSQSVGDNLSRVSPSGSLQSVAPAAAAPGNGANRSGFELLSGSATVDGAGGTFTNFDTVGAEGSGGGAGLGGVFFVNTNASLIVRNANFIGNTAKGGEGGGGGSVAVSDAGFVVSDKTLVGTSNFIAGFTGEVSGSASGGGFRLDRVTYGENLPPFSVLDGSTVAIQSTNSPVFARVQTSTPTGLTFASGAGLDVSQYVKSARVLGDQASAALLGGTAYTEPADVMGGNVSRLNVSLLPQADRLALQPGSAVVGTGIPAGVMFRAWPAQPRTE